MSDDEEYIAGKKPDRIHFSREFPVQQVNGSPRTLGTCRQSRACRSDVLLGAYAFPPGTNVR